MDLTVAVPGQVGLIPDGGLGWIALLAGGRRSDGIRFCRSTFVVLVVFECRHYGGCLRVRFGGFSMYATMNALSQDVIYW